MTSLKSKLAEFLKGIKSDAKPQAPRPKSQPTPESYPEPNGNDDAASESEPEEIIIEDMDDEKKKKKASYKKPFFNKSTSFPGEKKKDKNKKNKDNYGNFVNTQATGDVINIVGCNNFRWGNDYYMGNTKKQAPPKKYFQEEDSESEDDIKKCNLIKLLLEADIKPEHEYLDYISQNMDEKWHRFFVKLGFTPGRIKTFIIDNASYGVAEARYGLLLEWVNSKRDPTLGDLSDLLWKHGERRIVKELAIMYSADMAKC